MRRALLLLAALLGLGLVAGCMDLHALRPGERPTTQAQIEAWVQQQEYGLALEGLAQLPHTPGAERQRAEQIARVRRLAHDYEQATLATARRQYEAGAWADAEHTLETGLARLGPSKAVEQGLAKVRAARGRQLGDIARQRAMARATWLADDLPLRERMARADPYNPAATRELEQARHEAVALSRALYGYARQAIQARDLKLAERCLVLSTRLGELPEAKQTLAEVRGQLREARRRVVQARERNERQQVEDNSEQLIQEARSAVERGALFEASDLLLQLQRMAPGAPELGELEQAVSARRKAESARLAEQGTRAYQVGEIAAAKGHWEKALALDPTNEDVHENLERAQRVLETLRQIRPAAPAAAVTKPAGDSSCC